MSFNIYRKQMKELGLNTKQYAKLLKMPYEVVKNMIYDNEGNYSKEVNDVLRENMINKHQALENDFDNAKMKGMEIIMKDKILNEKIIGWYKNEYNLDMLKKKLNIDTIIEFEKKYTIMINDKKASHWYYSCILPKKFLDKVSNSTIYEFAEQLYDILVNGNEMNYLGNIFAEPKPKLNIDDDIVKWAKNYDIKAFMDKYNITNRQLSEELSIGYSTVCLVVAKQYFGKATLQKIKNYIEQKENNNVEIKEVEETNSIEENDEVDEDDNNTTNKFNWNVENKNMPIENTSLENQLNDNILRKILISRLTEEEKVLIKLFGGKLC